MKRLNYWGGILLGILLVFAIVYILAKRSQLKTEGRYTIGITTGKRGKFVKYTFEVGDKEYANENPILKYSPIVNGGRYYVKYLPTDLTVSEIYWDKPVPDYITDVPPEGWSSIPQ